MTSYAEAIDEFARGRIIGGRTYDALIATTARRRHITLLTRDERAPGTYEPLGADVGWLAT